MLAESKMPKSPKQNAALLRAQKSLVADSSRARKSRSYSKTLVMARRFLCLGRGLLPAFFISVCPSIIGVPIEMSDDVALLICSALVSRILWGIAGEY